MKKILALILAALMVMCALVACGDVATTGTTGTTDTTGTTATTEAPKPIEPYKALCYLPTGEDAKAINIANNEVVGALVAGDGVELVGGNFYVVNVDAEQNTNTALANVGAAFANTSMDAGIAKTKTGGAGIGGSWWKSQDNFAYDMNTYMDVAAMNTAMGADSTLGKFGTITITSLADGKLMGKLDGAEEAADLTNLKYAFSYFTYDGAKVKGATEDIWLNDPITVNQMSFIRYAQDMAYNGEMGSVEALWQAFLDNYGKTNQFNSDNVDLQTAALAVWKANLPVYQYAAALKNFNNLTEGDANTAAYTEKLAATREVYKKFCEKYEEAANLVLWDTENIENSVISYMFEGVEEADRKYPTLTYYFDAATETYIVFTTSAIDATVLKAS